MERPNTGEYHPNYQKYFDLVPSGDYLELLRLVVTYFEVLLCVISAFSATRR